MQALIINELINLSSHKSSEVMSNIRITILNVIFEINMSLARLELVMNHY